MTSAALKEMRDTSIKDVDAAGLVEIASVSIDAGQDVCERTREYLRQVGNPYCFLVEGTPVKISFSEAGKPLDNALLHYFLSLKQ